MPENCGMCTYSLDSKEALIRILHPADYDPAAPFPSLHDIERILVHELLHLNLAMLVRHLPDKDTIHMEQLIETISYTLVTLRRWQQHKNSSKSSSSK